VSLYYDGQRVGEGRVTERAICILADETVDVGRATATSPTDDYDIKHRRLQWQNQLGADRSRR